MTPLHREKIQSFWQIARLVFVIFSLYLLGDAFYRWDGFKYYGSFLEFIPSVALVTVFWSIIAVFTASLIWVLLKVFEWICRRMGMEVRTEHLLLSISIFVLLALSVWGGKKLISSTEALFVVKLLAIALVTIVSLFLTWCLRGKAESWVADVHERITPLVWLFGICLLVSVPLVGYHAWINTLDKTVLQNVVESSAAGRDSPNILLVTFDALTTRDMSAYGYFRDTTPFIKEWAKEASVFTNLKADSNWTPPTTTSMMTGKKVWTHLEFHEKGSSLASNNVESLPYQLKKNGYFNMVFIHSFIGLVEKMGVFRSFDIAPRVLPGTISGNIRKIISVYVSNIKNYDWIIAGDFPAGKLLLKATSDVSELTTTPEDVFNRFLRLIDNKNPEPFFTWIHFYPPHFPYLPPAPYAGMFDPSPKLRKYRNQIDFKEQLEEAKYLPHTYKEFPKGLQPDVAVLRARYNEYIRYCDEQFKKLILELEARGKLENTVVMLSSDHGESFEHNYITHGGQHFYEPVTNIPFIVKEPGQTEGRVIDNLTEQVDIPATVLQLAGIPVPSWMDGRSLVPLMRGESLPEKPVFSMTFQINPTRAGRIEQITKGTIAVWEGDYKLIHYLETEESLLFNLKNDTDELNNIVENEKEIGQHLLNLINENLEKANKRITRETVVADDNGAQ